MDQKQADALLTDLARSVRNGTMGIDHALARAFIAGAEYSPGPVRVLEAPPPRPCPRCSALRYPVCSCLGLARNTTVIPREPEPAPPCDYCGNPSCSFCLQL